MRNQAVAAPRRTAAQDRRRRIGLAGVCGGHAVNHMYGALLPLIYPILLIQFHFSYSVLGALWAEVIGATVDHFGFDAAFLVMGLSYLAAAFVLVPAGDPTRRA